MPRIKPLTAFALVCLILFLVVSFDNTRRLAENFHIGGGIHSYAFAGAVETGIIGLAVGVIVRRRQGQPAGGFVVTLLAVLLLSVVANFISGTEAFHPAFAILSKIRAWSLWWLLPLVFSATVPVLIFAFSELLATLLMEEQTQDQQEPQDGLTRVLAIYAESPNTTVRELAEALSISATTASRLRAQAMQQGLLARQGRGRYQLLRQPQERN